ncbi:MAG: hypothetical protein FJW30_22335 [Acidobacteria bacterium]|nr:hypothetical protein [Acidobacteriota bacterium]
MQRRSFLSLPCLAALRRSLRISGSEVVAAQMDSGVDDGKRRAGGTRVRVVGVWVKRDPQSFRSNGWRGMRLWKWKGSYSC